MTHLGMFGLLALIVAFGLGLGAGGWIVPGLLATDEVGQLRESERRLRGQLEHLQARLAARDGRSASQSAVPGGALGFSGDGVARPGSRSVAAATIEAYDRHAALSAARDRTPDTRAGRNASVSPVQVALDRFYQYVEEANGTGGLARWQRIQQITEELKATGPAGEDALMRVLGGGGSSDERRAAAQLLGELQVPRALPVLQEVLERDSDVLVRRAAASGLRRLQTADSIPVMESLLADSREDRFVRMSAASGLAEMDRSQGVAGLMQIFEEAGGDSAGRSLAFRALASLNDERALPFMRRLASSDAEVSYRLRAIRFLSAQGDRQALPALQQVIKSPNEPTSVREAAKKAHATIASQ